MDSKKLAKVIKIIVEHELKKQIPALKSLIKEEVTKELLKTNKIERSVVAEETVDPFSLANSMLDFDRREESHIVNENVEPKRFSKNPVINNILNETQPFSKTGVAPSALDQYSQGAPLNESYTNMDKTVSLDSIGAAGGIDAMRAQMAAKMGYGDMSSSYNSKTGLGVTTGLPGLDRILNRDNSELVKRFKTRK